MKSWLNGGYFSMERSTYFVMPNDREEFYNYLHDRKYKDKYYDKEYMISSRFPFYVDIDKKEVTVIESITMCACASSSGRIISSLEFKKSRYLD